jgi:hypothetical protein
MHRVVSFPCGHPCHFYFVVMAQTPSRRNSAKVAILQAHGGINEPDALAACAEIGSLTGARGVSALLTNEFSVRMKSQWAEVPTQRTVGAANDELSILCRHGW